MKYIAVDTETSGLDPEKHQLLQVGVIFDDFTLPVADLRSLEMVRLLREIAGQPYALNLNAAIIEKIANDPGDCCNDNYMLTALQVFANYHHAEDESVVIAGKNPTFDASFLKQLTPKDWKSVFGMHRRIAHRMLDPAILYMTADDNKPPSLAECLERAGFKAEVAHTSLDDALKIVLLLRHHFFDTLPLLLQTDLESYYAPKDNQTA